MLDSILNANPLFIDEEGFTARKNNQTYHYKFVIKPDDEDFKNISAKIKYALYGKPFVCPPHGDFRITRIIDTNIQNKDVSDRTEYTTTIKLYAKDILLVVIDLEYSDICEEVKDGDGYVDVSASFDQLYDKKNSWFVGVLCDETQHIDKIYTSIGYDCQHEFDNYKNIKYWHKSDLDDDEDFD